jgi:hypothetical protein
VREPIDGRIEELTDEFFNFLSQQPDAAMLFQRRDQLDEAKQLKREHLVGMVGGDYGKRMPPNACAWASSTARPGSTCAYSSAHSSV